MRATGSATMTAPLAGTTATPMGYEMELPVPPASVVTSPSKVTSRTSALLLSATTMVFAEAMTATPMGFQKEAPEPRPFRLPPHTLLPSEHFPPPPASVVTKPEAATMRMRWFPVSATTRAPLEGTKASAEGPLKPAVAPSPSARAPAQPCLPGTRLAHVPASVVTRPDDEMTRMRLLSVSATAMRPVEGFTATPCGELKDAAAPVPSAKPHDTL